MEIKNNGDVVYGPKTKNISSNLQNATKGFVLMLPFLFYIIREYLHVTDASLRIGIIVVMGLTFFVLFILGATCIGLQIAIKRGLPCLTLSAQGIKYQDLMTTRSVEWSDLEAFDVLALPSMPQLAYIRAPRTPSAVKRTGKKTFDIRPTAFLDVDVYFLKDELNRRREAAIHSSIK